MYMNEKMDAGDILMQRSIRIDLQDTNTTLFEKLSKLALEMLLEFLPNLFENDIHPIKQKEEEASFAPNLKKEIEHISFEEDVLKVYNHIRGLLEQPGAYFIWKDKKYKMEKVFFERSEETEAGIFKGLQENYLRIDCLNGFIKVFQIKAEGKNSMDAKAFYNGTGRMMTGEKLG